MKVFIDRNLFSKEAMGVYQELENVTSTPILSQEQQRRLQSIEKQLLKWEKVLKFLETIIQDQPNIRSGSGVSKQFK